MFIFIFSLLGGFICCVVLSGLGKRYLVLLLKFCSVLSLTGEKPKDISYKSEIN